MSKTSLVYNRNSKLTGLVPFYYRVRSCDTNMTSNTPANQYQRQKIIQNTVRVSSSLYTTNLASLSAYARPTTATHGVCWNQMSDRPVPSVQKGQVPTGSFNSLNGRHHSVTSSKPGSQSPGGIGCDIKHNSYDRYLNRLKGKGPLKRGIIPQNIPGPVPGISINPAFPGYYIPFNPAFPIYGGKTIKTGIVSGCDCCSLKNVDETVEQKIFECKTADARIYNNPFYQPYPDTTYGFNKGDYVYAIENGTNFYVKAQVTHVDGDVYTVLFADGTTEFKTLYELKIYYTCGTNCDTGPYGETDVYTIIDNIQNLKSQSQFLCSILSKKLLTGSDLEILV
jgi:hypothetical protein